MSAGHQPARRAAGIAFFVIPPQHHVALDRRPQALAVHLPLALAFQVIPEPYVDHDAAIPQREKPVEACGDLCFPNKMGAVRQHFVEFVEPVHHPQGAILFGRIHEQ